MTDEPVGGAQERPADFSRLGDLLAGPGGLPAAAAPSAPSGRPHGAMPRDSQNDGQDSARVVAAAWPEVVGPEVAANARPVHLLRGRLVVSASSSAWAQTLQLMSEAIMRGLTEHVGPGVVHEVVFRHAGWEERPRPPEGGQSAAELAARPRAQDSVGPSEPGAAPLSADQAEAFAVLDELDLPPGLRRTIARAMRAAFVRGEQDSVR